MLTTNLPTFSNIISVSTSPYDITSVVEPVSKNNLCTRSVISCVSSPPDTRSPIIQDMLKNYNDVYSLSNISCVSSPGDLHPVPTKKGILSTERAFNYTNSETQTLLDPGTPILDPWHPYFKTVLSSAFPDVQHEQVRLIQGQGHWAYDYLSCFYHEQYHDGRAVNTGKPFGIPILGDDFIPNPTQRYLTLDDCASTIVFPSPIEG